MGPTQSGETDRADAGSIGSAHEHHVPQSIASSASSAMVQEEANTEQICLDLDVTLQQDKAAAQAAKAIEAAGDARSLYATSTRSLLPAGLSRTPSVATAGNEDLEQRRLLRNYSDLMLPDYAEAIASQPLHHMRRGVEENNSDDRQFSLRKRHSLGQYARRHWVGVCLLSLAVLTVLTLMFMERMARAGLRLTSLEVSGLYPPDSPRHPKNRRHPENFHADTSECTFTNIPDYRYYGYRNPVNLSFIEDMEPFAGGAFDDLIISGVVEIRPATYDQRTPIEIITSVATTADWPAGMPTFDFARDTPFRVKLPRSKHQDSFTQSVHDGLKRRSEEVDHPESTRRECLSVWVGIYLSIPLENLEMHTKNLNIDIGLPKPYQGKSWYHLNVLEDTDISSQSGNISVSRLNSRRANVASEQGSIKGEYDLNDELRIETTTGEIKAQIEQRAVWEMNTHSPYTPANLTVRSNSGDQVVSVLLGLNGLKWADELGYPYPYLLNSDLQSESGSIYFLANDYWEGTATAETRNGSIKLGDEKWKLLSNSSDDVSLGQGPNRRRAKRGTENSTIFASTVGGDIDLCVSKYFICFNRVGYE